VSILNATKTNMDWPTWRDWVDRLNLKAHEQRRAARLRPADLKYFESCWQNGWTVQAALADWRPV